MMHSTQKPPKSSIGVFRGPKTPTWIVASLFFLGILMGLLCLPSTPAWGKPFKKPTIAVLEYRSGVQTSTDFTQRLITLLRKKTYYEVVDLDQAKQRIGSRIEGDVARCAGDAICMAKVGRKLKADEVLLVGLTQLGDVIVALSRILTKSSKVKGRVGISLSSGEGLSAKQLQKALRQLLPAKAFRRYGFIRIKCNEAGARISIGKKEYGLTPLDSPVKIKAPANYTITVGKKGLTTFQAKLSVPPDATITVNAKLIPRGARLGTPIYKKWWFWTVLGGSVAAAIAGSVAGVVLWHNSKSQPAKVLVTW